MMLFADVTFSTEGTVVIGVLLAALVTAIGVLYRQNVASHDKALENQGKQYESQILDKDNTIKTYKEMTSRAIGSLEVKANEILTGRGESPFTPLAAVVPRHNSPVTQRQQDDADLQTLKARAAAASLVLGIPVVDEPPEPPTVLDKLGLKGAPAVIAAVRETEAAIGVADDAAKNAAHLATQLAEATAKVKKDAK